MYKIGYYLLRMSTWIIHSLPMRINYVLSDFLFLISYYVVRYRRTVVWNNLRNSFPEKAVEELKQIEKRFYHHLCDVFIETLYYERISEKEAKERTFFLNPEVANDYLDQGRPVVTFCGHYNNWEWLSNWSLFSKHRFHPIYKRLKSKAFELFYFNFRSRLGSMPVERADTYRQLMEDTKNGIPTFTAFIADQTPRINDIQYWTLFLNQDTAVLTGIEKIAKKIDAAVLVAHMRKIKRGYYEVEYSVITDTPKDTAKFEITEKCTQFLEKIIREKPEYWLWSHKRWKHKKPVNN
jgi:Kdo2-lipid IVA lauroyltransferase/acyltransferase